MFTNVYQQDKVSYIYEVIREKKKNYFKMKKVSDNVRNTLYLLMVSKKVSRD